MDFLQLGEFALTSGLVTGWKIECDAITKGEWDCLAAMAAQILPPFGGVVGIPQGGLPFAKALEYFVTEGPLLVADDVWMTGDAMQRFAADMDVPWIAVVAFSRGPIHMPNVTALFYVNEGLHA